MIVRVKETGLEFNPDIIDFYEREVVSNEHGTFSFDEIDFVPATGFPERDI